MSGISRLFELAAGRSGTQHIAAGYEPLDKTGYRHIQADAPALEPMDQDLKRLEALRTGAGGSSAIGPDPYADAAQMYARSGAQDIAKMSMKDAAQALLMTNHSPGEGQMWKQIWQRAHNNEQNTAEAEKSLQSLVGRMIPAYSPTTGGMMVPERPLVPGTFAPRRKSLPNTQAQALQVLKK